MSIEVRIDEMSDEEVENDRFEKAQTHLKKAEMVNGAIDEMITFARTAHSSSWRRRLTTRRSDLPALQIRKARGPISTYSYAFGLPRH